MNTHTKPNIQYWEDKIRATQKRINELKEQEKKLTEPNSVATPMQLTLFTLRLKIRELEGKLVCFENQLEFYKKNHPEEFL